VPPPYIAAEGAWKRGVTKKPVDLEPKGEVDSKVASGREGSGFGRERWKPIEGWKMGSFAYARIQSPPALLDFLNPELPNPET